MCHIIYLQFGINNFLRLITSWYKNKNDNGAKVKQRDNIARRTTSSSTLLVCGEEKIRKLFVKRSLAGCMTKSCRSPQQHNASVNVMFGIRLGSSIKTSPMISIRSSIKLKTMEFPVIRRY